MTGSGRLFGRPAHYSSLNRHRRESSIGGAHGERDGEKRPCAEHLRLAGVQGTNGRHIVLRF